MHDLLCKHKVADFTWWLRVFENHADPDLVVLLFRADDPKQARAFTESPDAGESAQISGVVGVPEISLLSD